MTGLPFHHDFKMFPPTARSCWRKIIPAGMDTAGGRREKSIPRNSQWKTVCDSKPTSEGSQTGLVIHPYFLEKVITESQNVQGWKGPVGVI